MKVDPEYAGFGEFFAIKPMYRVPKYQRSYAWEENEIEDYLKDLTDCYNKRKSGSPSNHFFGGIVSVETTVPGALRQKEYELVDGQQRFSTFVLTAASIIHVYENNLLVESITNGDTINQGIIENRINDLKKRFIQFEQEVHRVPQVVDALVMSKADADFFKDVINNNDPSTSRESHIRIKNAYNKIKLKVESLILGPTLTDKMDELEMFQMVLDQDFSLINIITHSKREAYKLFQVLNDRGKSLTEGDLLRAKTLELIEGHNTAQDSTETLWDKILVDQP